MVYVIMLQLITSHSQSKARHKLPAQGVGTSMFDIAH